MNISPTDLRISTHTATCNINSFINLSIIAKYLDIDKESSFYVDYFDKYINFLLKNSFIVISVYNSYISAYFLNVCLETCNNLLASEAERAFFIAHSILPFGIGLPLYGFLPITF